MHEKIEKKFLVFEIIPCEWVALNCPLLGREHLSTSVIVLTNKLNLGHITKGDFLQLNCLLVEQ